MNLPGVPRRGIPTESVPEQLIYNAAAETLVLSCRRQHMGEVYIRSLRDELYARVLPEGHGLEVSLDGAVSASSAPLVFCHVVRNESFEKGFLAHHLGIFSVNLLDPRDSHYVVTELERSMVPTRLLGVSADGNILYCTVRMRQAAESRSRTGFHALVAVEVTSGISTVLQHLDQVFF